MLGFMRRYDESYQYAKKNGRRRGNWGSHVNPLLWN